MNTILKKETSHYFVSGWYNAAAQWTEPLLYWSIMNYSFMDCYLPKYPQKWGDAECFQDFGMRNIAVSLNHGCLNFRINDDEFARVYL